MSARSVPQPPVGPLTYVRPPLTRPQKYEKLAFTFCRLGTTGLIVWALVLEVRRPYRGAPVLILLGLAGLPLGQTWKPPS